jgi:phosphoribosyl-AMP cyclohydrolase
MNPIEESTELSLDFRKISKVAKTGQAVLPVVLQNAETDEVLFIAYANEEALKESLRTRRAVLWSTSRNELWRKGEGSGDVLELVEIRVNCEQNSLLYRVRPIGDGVCHTRDAAGKARRGCYYRRVSATGEELEFV